MPHSDYLPTGTLRTGFLRLPNHVANLLYHHNHLWFHNFVTDFITKNQCEQNGIQDGCVISRPGVDYEIQCTSGSMDLHGTNINVSTPSNENCVSDGWYVAYLNSVGTMVIAYLTSDNIQAALPPDDSVFLGFAIRQGSSFYVYSFFNKPTDGYLKQQVLETDREIIAKRSNVIVGTQAQKDAFTATHTIDDLTDANLSDGDKIDFLDGTHAPSANISISKAVWTEFQSRDAIIDLTGGKTIIFSGNDHIGMLRVTNASNDSVGSLGLRTYLILESDNDDCLNFPGTATGTILHNGIINASGAEIDGNMLIGGTVDADGFTINGVPVSTSSDSFWSTESGGIYYPDNVRIGGTFKSVGKVLNPELYARTEAEVEAEAALRRKETGGSGFLEWGKLYDGGGDYWKIESGLWGHRGYSNYFLMGRSGGTGISNTDYSLQNVNGYKIRFIDQMYTYLPPEPTATVESTTTTTQNYSKGEFITVDSQAYICIADSTTGALLTNTSYFETSDSVSRKDLVFPESWHEVISDKDFIYPYGNTQSLLATCPDTGLTLVNGSFTGFGTYSLFGNWQSSGDLIGKGLVWSTLSDANKQKLLSNPENNLYVNEDGDIVQIRYRVRVVQGLGNEWSAIDTQESASLQVSYDGGVSPAHRLSLKGSQVSVSSDYNGTYYFANKSFIEYSSYGFTWSQDEGVFLGGYYSGGHMHVPDSIAYKGRCFALPITLVQRARNEGAYHPIYNREGSSKFLTDGDETTYSTFTWDNLANSNSFNDTELFSNNGGYPMETFTGASISGFSATNTTGYGCVKKNIAVTPGTLMKAVWTISGTDPSYLDFRVSNDVNLSTGTLIGVLITTNKTYTAYFVVGSATAYCGFWINSGVMVDFSVTDFTLQEVNPISSLSDCITYADPDSGQIADAVSGRPDDLYSDEINEADIQDLRMDSNPCTDMERYMGIQALKANAGEMRGFEKQVETHIHPKVVVRTGDAVGTASTNWDYLTFSASGDDESISYLPGSRINIIGSNGGVFVWDSLETADPLINWKNAANSKVYIRGFPKGSAAEMATKFNNTFPGGTTLTLILSEPKTTQSA